jgi:hypothetical protein
MFMDTAGCPSGWTRTQNLEKRKSRARARLVETFSRLKVSQTRSNYLGGVAGAFGAAGLVVLGLVAPGVVGLAAAGLVGAGTPDCEL